MIKMSQKKELPTTWVHYSQTLDNVRDTGFTFFVTLYLAGQTRIRYLNTKPSFSSVFEIVRLCSIYLYLSIYLYKESLIKL